MPSLPSLPGIEFSGEWGKRGEDPGDLANPVGPAMDSDDRVYFADRGTRFLQKFDLRGTPLLSFGAESMRGASGIAIDSGGAIYVADARAGDIVVFFPEGALLRVMHVAPQRSYDGPFQFSVGADGKIYIPDAVGSRIQVLGPTGKIERTWRVASAAAKMPARPVAAIVSPDGFVYVGEETTGQIVKFTSAGQEVTRWAGAAGPAAPLLGLAASSKYVIALRAASPHIQIWNSDGQPVLADDLGGQLKSSSPAHLSFALGSHGDLIVLDSEVPRVLRFRVHLEFP